MKNVTQKMKENTPDNNRVDTDAEHSSNDLEYIDYILGYDKNENERDNNTLYEELPIEKWYFD